MFHEPLHVIHGKFTRSELVVMSWRSRETSANMSRKFKESATAPSTAGKRQPDRVEEMALTNLEKKMGGVAAKATTEDGDIDLGRLTGAEALQYMGALGIHMGGRS